MRFLPPSLPSWFFCLGLAAGLSAQLDLPKPLSGSYTVDPQGSGDRVFRDLATVTRYLSFAGVSGDCEVLIKPGEYKGSMELHVIPGRTEDRRITLRAETPGTVKLHSENTILRLFEDVCGLTLDGLEFGASGQGSAIAIGTGCTDLEIRNCKFPFVSGGTRLIEVEGRNRTRRLNIHHNVFEIDGQRSAGIYTQGTYALDIHHNEFVCRDAREVISLWNANKSESKIRHNLFRGSIQTCGLRLDVSGHDVDVFDNLFLVATGGAGDAVIRSNGMPGKYNRIEHNLFAVRGPGVAVMSRGRIALDDNIYAFEEDLGGVGNVGNVRRASLKEWQEAIAPTVEDEKSDQHSAVAGRKFFIDHGDLIARIAPPVPEAENGGDDPEAVPVAKKPPVADAAAEVRLLIGALADKDPAVLRLAIRGLMAYGRKAIPAVPSLSRLCSHPHASVRADAVTALGQIRIGVEIVIPEMMRMLTDEDERVLVATMTTLVPFAHLASDAAGRLKVLEGSDSPAVARAAKKAYRAVTGTDTPPKTGDGKAGDGKAAKGGGAVEAKKLP